MLYCLGAIFISYSYNHKKYQLLPILNVHTYCYTYMPIVILIGYSYTDS